ncbi:MAG: zf-HC2 domain-containing protein, partial [Planctomycetales bacterium]|nr:zf-HC2 domain-containing protein [Planctomycetales bacterium]
MTAPSKQPDWHDWLKAGLSASNPTSSHVVDDEELIACWAEGLLGVDEEAALREHLSGCVDCRHRISDMIRDGSLDIKAASTPELVGRPESDRVDLRKEGPRESGKNWVTAALALAACLLIAFLWQGGAGETSQLALARAELESGQSDAAYQRLVAFL